MTESIMDRLRDIVLFVAGIIAVGALIMAAFEGLSQRVASASFLATLGVVCVFMVFMPKLEVFKVWGIEARLTKTLDRAEEIMGKLQHLSAISARASYLTIAWGNRVGAPTASDRQAVLDDIDAQLRELNVTASERAVIVQPWIRMVKADFFFIFTRVLREFATLKDNSLVVRNHAAPSQEATDASMRHSDLITAWNIGNGEFGAFERLTNQSLATVLNDYVPKKGGWLSDEELKVVDAFKQRLIRLDEECEQKGGYTKEAAQFYDGMTNHEKEKAAEMWEAVSK